MDTPHHTRCEGGDDAVVIGGGDDGGGGAFMFCVLCFIFVFCIDIYACLLV